MSAAHARELSSLTLSCARVDNASLVLRAVRWHNMLARLGARIPFFATHDIGMLFVAPTGALEIGVQKAVSAPQFNPTHIEQLNRWAEILRSLVETDLVKKGRAWRLQDELVVVLILRTIGPIASRVSDTTGRQESVGVPLDAELVARAMAKPTEHFQLDRYAAFLSALTRSPLRVLLAFEMIDHDTLRLLGGMAKSGGSQDALGVLDLFEVLATPESNDVVNFTLDLLPSVLETKRASGQQTFSIDGYAGLDRRGTLDSLMLSELAFDEDLFDQRYIENELFYYTREKQNDRQGALHYICVDASASMRGQRATFARGLGLTLAKKLILRGENVLFRFFDGRLYDPLVIDGRRSAQTQRALDVPYILGFKGEHGRNYTQVFELLAQDVARRAKSEGARPIVYLLTHSECHAPLAYVQRLASVAQLYGIFVMPSSGTLDLEYLPLLTRTQIVDESSLSDRKSRQRRALDIVDDAAVRNTKPLQGSIP